jgi:hypothetical protein
MKRQSILLASVVVATMVVVEAFRQANHYRTELAGAIQAVKAKEDTLMRYRDMAGSEHAGRLIVEASYATLSELYRRDMDSVARRLRIRPQQVTGVTSFGTLDTGSTLAPVMYIHDTVYRGRAFHDAYRFTAGDRYIAIEGVADSAGAALDWSIRDSLTVTAYWKRRRVLARKRLYIDAYSVNPKCHVSGLEGMQIAEPRHSRFGLGVFGGVMVPSMQPGIGIGLYYTIIHF